MAWEPIESWLAKGWSLPRVVAAIISGIITVATVIGYAAHPHHPGAVWWVVWAIAAVAIWAVLEMLRWRIRHNRMEQKLALHTAPISSTHPGPTPPARPSHIRYGVGNIFADEPELLEQSGAKPWSPPPDPASPRRPETQRDRIYRLGMAIYNRALDAPVGSSEPESPDAEVGSRDVGRTIREHPTDLAADAVDTPMSSDAPEDEDAE